VRVHHGPTFAGWGSISNVGHVAFAVIELNSSVLNDLITIYDYLLGVKIWSESRSSTEELFHSMGSLTTFAAVLQSDIGQVVKPKLSVAYFDTSFDSRGTNRRITVRERRVTLSLHTDGTPFNSLP